MDKKTKLEQFQDLEALIRKASKEEAEKVYIEKAAQYDVPTVPYHVHNNIDSPRISEDDIIITNKLQTQLISLNPSGSPETETFTLRNVTNISRISFHGYAANNASSPATQRASISGEIIFGRCFSFTGTGSSIAVTTTNNGTPFVQSCNFMFIDSTNINLTRVGTAPNLAFTIDSTATPAAVLNLLTYTNNDLIFEITLGAQWKLEGNIIIE